jgi:hypothetical protein
VAVNTGYSIGFGYPTEEYEIVGHYVYFSTLYVLLGASFVSVALGFFAEKVTRDRKSWFTRMQYEKEIAESIKQRHAYFQGNIQAWVFHNSKALKAVSLWLGFIAVMIAYSMVAIKWPFAQVSDEGAWYRRIAVFFPSLSCLLFLQPCNTQAQYFAVSTLSTGGLMSIPHDAETWVYGLTGIMAMLGVPVMALAMAEIAQVLVFQGNLDETKAIIDARDRFGRIHWRS